MKKILITGAMGQLGSELTTVLRKQYGQTTSLVQTFEDQRKGRPF